MYAMTRYVFDITYPKCIFRVHQGSVKNIRKMYFDISSLNIQNVKTNKQTNIKKPNFKIVRLTRPHLKLVRFFLGFNLIG